MFIRHTEKKDLKTGKKYFTYQLIESYRAARGPRQRVLLNLTSCPDLDKEQRKQLANRIEEIVVGTLSLFPYPAEIEELAKHFALMLTQKQSTPYPESQPDKEEQDLATVDLKSLQTEYCRSVGAEHIVLHTINKLGLKDKFVELGFTDSQIRCAFATIVAKAVHPSSERESWRWLKNNSGLDTLLKTSFSKLSSNPLYEISDLLMKHKTTLEEYLRSKEKGLFGLPEAIILYDITNTFFEGSCSRHPMAARGKSKEKRADRPLISLGLVLDVDGFPKCTDFLEGNVSESKTLLAMIDKLNGQVSSSIAPKPIIVMDSGIATKANIVMLKEQGYRYIVMMKKKCRPRCEDAQDVVVKDSKDNKVSASLVDDPETGDKNLYCYSTARHKRELNIQQGNQEKLEKELCHLADGLPVKRRLKDYPKVLKKIGGLKQKYKRVAGYYTFHVGRSDDGKLAISLKWEVDSDGLSQALSGTYGMRTNIANFGPKTLWNIYISLSHAEEAFRMLKSEIGLRPIFHQNEERINAHLFLTILTYHVVASIRHQLKGQGIFDSWNTIKNTLMTHMIVTTTVNKADGARIHMRGSSMPEASHKALYQALGCSFQPVPMTKATL